MPGRCFLFGARRLPRAPLPEHGVTALGAVSCTASAGVTQPSSLVLAHAPHQIPRTAFEITLMQPVFAGCCEPLLENGASRRYFCNPCTVVWTHTPPQSSSARVRFFPEDIGLTIRFSRSACGSLPAMQLQQGPRFRGCSHSVMFRPPHSLDPRVAPTVAHSTCSAAGPSTPRRTWFVTSPSCGIATWPNRTIAKAGPPPAGLQLCRLLKTASR